MREQETPVGEKSKEAIKAILKQTTDRGLEFGGYTLWRVDNSPEKETYDFQGPTIKATLDCDFEPTNEICAPGHLVDAMKRQQLNLSRIDTGKLGQDTWAQIEGNDAKRYVQIHLDRFAELSIMKTETRNLPGIMDKEREEIKKNAMNTVADCPQTENKAIDEIVEEILPTMDVTLRGWIKQYLIVTAKQRGWKRIQIARATASITAYVEFLGPSIKDNRRNLSIAMQNLTQNIYSY